MFQILENEENAIHYERLIFHTTKQILIIKQQLLKYVNENFKT